jgi:hypothetical protein
MKSKKSSSSLATDTTWRRKVAKHSRGPSAGVAHASRAARKQPSSSAEAALRAMPGSSRQNGSGPGSGAVSRTGRSIKHGRIVGGSRATRAVENDAAVENKSKFGRCVEGATWVDHEFDMICRLHDARANVQRPHLDDQTFADEFVEPLQIGRQRARRQRLPGRCWSASIPR